MPVCCLRPGHEGASPSSHPPPPGWSPPPGRSSQIQTAGKIFLWVNLWGCIHCRQSNLWCTCGAEGPPNLLLGRQHTATPAPPPTAASGVVDGMQVYTPAANKTSERARGSEEQSKSEVQSSGSRREKTQGGTGRTKRDAGIQTHWGVAFLGHTHKHVLLGPRNARGARTGGWATKMKGGTH